MWGSGFCLKNVSDRVCTYLGNPSGFSWILWAAMRVHLSDTGAKGERLDRSSRVRPFSSVHLHRSLYSSQATLIGRLTWVPHPQVTSCVCVYVHVRVCASVCESKDLLGCCPQEHYPLPLRRGFSLAWSSAIRPDWLARKLQRCSCLFLLSAGVTDTHNCVWHFYMGIELGSSCSQNNSFTD